MNYCRYSPRIAALLIVALLITSPGSQAQLYINFSNNLPDDGATGQSVDVYSEDMDNDGDLDIILANEYQPNVLLLNSGAGFYTKALDGTIPPDVHDSEDIAVADFNGDGWKDIVFVSEDDFEHEYYLNNGNMMFEFAQFLPFTICNAVASGDIDNDTYPDIFLANRGQNLILVNDGSGGLDNETPSRLPLFFDLSHDVKLVDVENDGDLDAFLANEQVNLLFINDGAGHFTDQSAFRLPQGLPIDTRKVTFGDVDGDGDLDVFLSTVKFQVDKDPQNRLFLNDGEGYFTDVTATHLPAVKDQTLDAVFLDIDVDGDLDLVLAGVIFRPLKFYLNNGSGVFTDQTVSVMGSYDFFRDSLDALGIAVNDFNADGYSDLYICNRAGKDLLLFRDPAAILTSTTEQVLRDPAVLLFPNPVAEQLTVELPQWEGATPQFSLLDQTGRLLRHFEAQKFAETYQLDLGPISLHSGLYFLQIQLETTRITRKVFIE
ncbi:MAG: T9SS type A sorting domain-containing protein [Bacteroidota bacterium]